MPITGKPRNWSCEFDGNIVADSGGGLVVSCELPLDDVLYHWGQDYVFKGPISVRAFVSGDRSGVSVELSLKGKGEVPCARCLEPASLAISGDFLYFYRPLPGNEEGTGETAEGSGEEDVILIDTVEKVIDISEQVWESLILSLPEKSLCSESCLGLCSFCGGNLNNVKCSCSKGQADPRFEALAGLMEQGNGDVPGKGGDSGGNSKK